MTTKDFKLTYVERDDLYRDIPKELTLTEILGPFRDPKSLLSKRLMEATLKGASHPNDFYAAGIPVPEVDMKEFYV
ncbi:hypothetical protein HON71_04960 [Candidatus Woesearchaeota archaeon]|jgi:hypothetical protein|nr:hypothetical protein [Candidatus Woesearchaeota archaeon]MBT5342384.1 hypothetical protein [Candidatus Woesearchaeota archaeon]